MTQSGSEVANGATSMQQVATMRWTMCVGFLVMSSLIGVSCGGDEESSEKPATAGPVKLDGSKLSGCFADSDCKNGLVCYGEDTNSMTAAAGFCTDACQTDDPFAAGNVCAAINGFAAACSPEGECRIDCTGSGKGDGKCPANMECRDADPREMETVYRCLYPIGTGRGKTRDWAECKPARGDADCASPNVCVASGMGQNQRGYCSAPCTNDAECSAPAGVTARPLCAATLDACSLDCADGASCPAGMECIDTAPGQQVTMRCRFAPPPAI